MRRQNPLTPDFLLQAYRRGSFPMAPNRSWRGPLAWFSPEERGMIPLDAPHVPRRLRDRIRSARFTVTADRDFEGVIRGCARPRPDQPDTWINDDILRLYVDLYSAGHAHSVEAWLPAGMEERVLVGGIYGVHIGAAFFAESKFCRPELGGTDASKVCLAHLMLHLRQRGFLLLDTQYWTEHLAQFGCTPIPRREYLRILEAATARQVEWKPFSAEANLEQLAEDRGR
jgi:leucyl/phenylalanyl-tRNA---protein transferase